jgi:hypothetical protein
MGRGMATAQGLFDLSDLVGLFVQRAARQDKDALGV